MKHLRLLFYLLIITYSIKINGQNNIVKLIISSDVTKTSKLIKINVTLINNTQNTISICPLHFENEDYSDIFWIVDISNDNAQFRPFSKPVNISQCFPKCKNLVNVKASSRICMSFYIDLSTLVRLNPTFDIDKNKIDSFEKDYDLYMNPPGNYNIKLRYHYDKGDKKLIYNLESNVIKIEYQK